MATSYTGEKMRIKIAPVPDRAAFNATTALASALDLHVRSVDASLSPETFSFDLETGDASSYWAEGESTIGQAWSVSCDGYFHPQDPAYLVVEHAIWREDMATSPVAVGEYVYLWYYPAGVAAGMRIYHGFARPADLGIPGDRGGAIESSYSFNGSGKLNRSVVPT